MTAAGPLVRQATALEAAVIAALHAACFPERPWREPAVVDILAMPGSLAFLAARDGEPVGFALARAMAGEAELLSLGVLPAYRGCGLGRRLVEALCHAAAALGARAIYLEVAADNRTAQRLYQALGFRQSGRRKDYYHHDSGEAVDALVLRRGLD